ncbi:hypothetical protein M8J76_000615 [Diaphorina citri]|nr:hypothetical protein M8J76_000615 [Diaphorina citri]
MAPTTKQDDIKVSIEYACLREYIRKIRPQLPKNELFLCFAWLKKLRQPSPHRGEYIRRMYSEIVRGYLCPPFSNGPPEGDLEPLPPPHSHGSSESTDMSSLSSNQISMECKKSGLTIYRLGSDVSSLDATSNRSVLRGARSEPNLMSKFHVKTSRKMQQTEREDCMGDEREGTNSDSCYKDSEDLEEEVRQEEKEGREDFRKAEKEDFRKESRDELEFEETERRQYEEIGTRSDLVGKDYERVVPSKTGAVGKSAGHVTESENERDWKSQSNVNKDINEAEINGTERKSVDCFPPFPYESACSIKQLIESAHFKSISEIEEFKESNKKLKNNDSDNVNNLENKPEIHDIKEGSKSSNNKRNNAEDQSQQKRLKEVQEVFLNRKYVGSVGTGKDEQETGEVNSRLSARENNEKFHITNTSKSAKDTGNNKPSNLPYSNEKVAKIHISDITSDKTDSHAKNTSNNQPVTTNANVAPYNNKAEESHISNTPHEITKNAKNITNNQPPVTINVTHKREPNTNAKYNTNVEYNKEPNANVEYNTNVEYNKEPNANVKYNTNVEYNKEPNANVKYNTNVEYNKEPNANVEYNTNVEYNKEPNANVKYNTNVEYNKEPNANVKYNTNVEYNKEPNANVKYNTNVEYNKEPNANVKYNTNVEYNKEPNANVKYNTNVEYKREYANTKYDDKIAEITTKLETLLEKSNRHNEQLNSLDVKFNLIKNNYEMERKEMMLKFKSVDSLHQNILSELVKRQMTEAREYQSLIDHYRGQLSERNTEIDRLANTACEACCKRRDTNFLDETGDNSTVTVQQLRQEIAHLTQINKELIYSYETKLKKLRNEKYLEHKLMNTLLKAQKEEIEIHLTGQKYEELRRLAENLESQFGRIVDDTIRRAKSEHAQNAK